MKPRGLGVVVFKPTDFRNVFIPPSFTNPMPKDKVEELLERIASLEARLESEEAQPSKSSTTKGKKASNKIMVDHLRDVVGLTLAIGHPRKKVMDEDGKQMLDENGYGMTQGDDMSRSYITFGSFIDWKATEGQELFALAKSVDGRVVKGRYDGHMCSAIAFKGGKIPPTARKTIEKLMGRKIQKV